MCWRSIRRFGSDMCPSNSILLILLPEGFAQLVKRFERGHSVYCLPTAVIPRSFTHWGSDDDAPGLQPVAAHRLRTVTCLQGLRHSEGFLLPVLQDLRAPPENHKATKALATSQAPQRYLCQSRALLVPCSWRLYCGGVAGKLRMPVAVRIWMEERWLAVRFAIWDDQSSA